MFGKTNDKHFGRIFEDHISNTIACAQKLHALFLDLGNAKVLIRNIVELEHKGDELTREAHHLLDRTFITRIDKCDIITLINELDHIIDFMKATAIRIDIYHITAVRSEACDFADVILAMTKKLQKLISELSEFQPDQVRGQVIEIKELEEKADSLLHKAIENLFSDEDDAKQVMKWQDVFEKLELVTDHCEDVANVVSSIVRKEAR